MAPAWGGAVGNAMLDAALGYTNALLEAPKEDVERQKSLLALEEQRARVDLSRANAEWLRRRQQAGGSTRPITARTKRGDVLERDPETGDWRIVYVDPGLPLKPLDAQKRFDNRQIELLEEHYGRPLEELTQEELNHPAVSDTVDLLRRREAIYSTPDGFVRRRDVRQQSPLPGAPTPAAPPTGPSSAAPAPSPPSPPAVGPISDIKASPQDIARYKAMFQGMPKDKAEVYVSALVQGKGAAAKARAAAAIQAFHDTYQGWPADTSFEGQPPPTPTTESPGAPLAAQPPGPVTTQATPAGTVPVVRTPGQVTAEAEKEVERLRKAEDQQIQRDRLAMERERLSLDKLNAERQQREQDAKRQSELAGRVTPEMAGMTTLLYSQGVVKQPYFAQLLPQEKTLVLRHLMEPKRRKEEREALKLAGPSLDELSALDATMDLTELIIPLLKSGNMGWFGAGKSAWTYAKNLVGSSDWWKAAEKSLKDEGVSGPISEAMVRAKQAAMIEQNDDKVKDMMSPIAQQAALQTLSSILAYTHAMAIKRTGAGTARGVIKSDMDAAHKLFDPSKFFASPDELLTNLYNLQKFIQQARPRLEDRIRSFHIDPSNRHLMDFQLTLEPAAGESPSPVQITPEQEQLLQDALTPPAKRP